MSYKQLGTFWIAGVEHRDDFVKSLINENRLRIGSFFRLVPEPSNPADKLAVKLMAGGHHFGYVPRRWTRYVHIWIQKYGLENLRAVYRGKKKVSVVLLNN